MFWCAEFTFLHTSGILALVTLGLFMTYKGKTQISTESQHALHHVWGYVGFIAETLIFILSGVIIGDKIVLGTFYDPEHAGKSLKSIELVDFAKVFAAYLMLHLVRFVCIMIFYPCLKKMGYGMTMPQVIMCSYAGLRGAVGLSLALMVSGNELISSYVRNIILVHVSGVALLTLLINATTTGFLVKALKLNHYSDLRKNILYSVSLKVDKNIDENIKDLKRQQYFKHVKWNDLRNNVKMKEIQDDLKDYQALSMEHPKNE